MPVVRDVQAVVFGQPVTVPVPVFGACPVCAANGREGFIYRGDRAFNCTAWPQHRCPFTVYHEFRGRTIDEEVLLQLIERPFTDAIDGFVSQDGKRHYAMRLCLKDGRVARFDGSAEAGE